MSLPRGTPHLTQQAEEKWENGGRRKSEFSRAQTLWIKQINGYCTKPMDTHNFKVSFTNIKSQSGSSLCPLICTIGTPGAIGMYHSVRHSLDLPVITGDFLTFRRRWLLGSPSDYFVV